MTVLSEFIHKRLKELSEIGSLGPWLSFRIVLVWTVWSTPGRGLTVVT